MRNNVFLNEKVAKKLFKNEKYGKVLSAKVISDIMDVDYEIIYNNIKLSTEEISFSSKTLSSTADAIYTDDIRYFNIEINFYNSRRKERQLSSYTYQLYLGQLHTYKDYNKIKKIVQISIDSYDYFNKGDFIYHVYFMDNKHHIKENDDITKIHINLEYLRKIDYTDIEISGNKLMHDLYFLICEDRKKLDSVYGKDNLMSEIIDESKKIAGIMDLDLYLTDDEIRKLDQEDYYKQGMEEGINNTNRKMVINMHKNNIDINTISQIADLSVCEIESIINSKDN